MTQKPLGRGLLPGLVRTFKEEEKKQLLTTITTLTHPRFRRPSYCSFTLLFTLLLLNTCLFAVTGNSVCFFFFPEPILFLRVCIIEMVGFY